MRPRILVVAKAPVPGLAKTRLGDRVGMPAAADIAAAALLDTLAQCEIAFLGGRHVALTGDVTQSARREEIEAALHGWTVHEQRGDGFAERLAHAHADLGPGPVVQIGMDTPHVTADLLVEVTAGLRDHDAVLGLAEDGGWWVLALRDPADAEVLRDIPPSTPETGALTLAALRELGLDVATVDTLRDVDTVEDAVAVAALVPASRFAAAWSGAHEVAR